MDTLLAYSTVGAERESKFVYDVGTPEQSEDYRSGGGAAMWIAFSRSLPCSSIQVTTKLAKEGRASVIKLLQTLVEDARLQSTPQPRAAGLQSVAAPPPSAARMEIDVDGNPAVILTDRQSAFLLLASQIVIILDMTLPEIEKALPPYAIAFLLLATFPQAGSSREQTRYSVAMYNRFLIRSTFRHRQLLTPPPPANVAEFLEGMVAEPYTTILEQIERSEISYELAEYYFICEKYTKAVAHVVAVQAFVKSHKTDPKDFQRYCTYTPERLELLLKASQAATDENTQLTYTNPRISDETLAILMAHLVRNSGGYSADDFLSAFEIDRPNPIPTPLKKLIASEAYAGAHLAAAAQLSIYAVLADGGDIETMLDGLPPFFFTILRQYPKPEAEAFCSKIFSIIQSKCPAHLDSDRIAHAYELARRIAAFVDTLPCWTALNATMRAPADVILPVPDPTHPVWAPADAEPLHRLAQLRSDEMVRIYFIASYSLKNAPAISGISGNRKVHFDHMQDLQARMRVLGHLDELDVGILHLMAGTNNPEQEHYDEAGQFQPILDGLVIGVTRHQKKALAISLNLKLALSLCNFDRLINDPQNMSAFEELCGACRDIATTLKGLATFVLRWPIHLGSEIVPIFDVSPGTAVDPDHTVPLGVLRVVTTIFNIRATLQDSNLFRVDRDVNPPLDMIPVNGNPEYGRALAYLRVMTHQLAQSLTTGPAREVRDDYIMQYLSDLERQSLTLASHITLNRSQFKTRSWTCLNLRGYETSRSWLALFSQGRSRTRPFCRMSGRAFFGVFELDIARFGTFSVIAASPSCVARLQNPSLIAITEMLRLMPDASLISRSEVPPLIRFVRTFYTKDETPPEDADTSFRLADLHFAAEMPAEAAKFYIEGLAVATSYFSKTESIGPLLSSPLTHRLVGCFRECGDHFSTVFLGQFFPMPDYTFQFANLRLALEASSKPYPGDDGVFAFLWDVVLLEYVVAFYKKRNDMTSVEAVIKDIGRPELGVSTGSWARTQYIASRAKRYLKFLFRKHWG
ncbi:hypothetical protein BDK51DRAFT_52333 [Blyttiomyces helicus]|uniref:INTS8 TPR repeats domain-containing protein n=1 Tax=Blyttiomyces helicus TaxID=388810 RepID=A0A4P9WL63_9FUNG|nr:hypothetical protein BDK51DRAFT_52333 [Blyttiomyces helicus]|eukprot:RKO93594.1 hypothetical protein BDK51DRAFT_52333 [Blyttiomyces helicus]